MLNKIKLSYSFIFIFLIGLFSFNANAQVLGIWKTIDDDGETVKSHVEIFEQNGKYYGKVVKLFRAPEEEQNPKCIECNDAKKDQPILGMEILSDLQQKGKYWQDGQIMDPENGKYYKCYLELLAPDKLKVRGYMGISALGRTQYWYRITE